MAIEEVVLLALLGFVVGVLAAVAGVLAVRG